MKGLDNAKKLISVCLFITSSSSSYGMNAPKETLVRAWYLHHLQKISDKTPLTWDTNIPNLPTELTRSFTQLAQDVENHFFPTHATSKEELKESYTQGYERQCQVGFSKSTQPFSGISLYIFIKNILELKRASSLTPSPALQKITLPFYTLVMDKWDSDLTASASSLSAQEKKAVAAMNCYFGNMDPIHCEPQGIPCGTVQEALNAQALQQKCTTDHDE